MQLCIVCYQAFTISEMEAVADVVRRHPNLLVISDEVHNNNKNNNTNNNNNNNNNG